MVSLRALENSAEIRLEKRDDIPWERIRSEMQWWLLRRGMNDSQAEEIVDEAIVRVFATMPEPDHVANPGRIKIDVRMTIGSILHEQSAQRAMFRHDMQDITTDRRLSRLTPAKNQTHVNDAIANRRATQILFRWFSAKYFPVSNSDVSQDCDNSPASIVNPVWCFLFDDSYLASLPTSQDTWQPIPIRYEYSCRSYTEYAIAYRTAID